MKFEIEWIWTRLARWILALGVAVWVTACATGIVFHGFSFDVPKEIEVVDYRYGDSSQPRAMVTDRDRAVNRVRQSVSMAGEFLKPDFLYVKWRFNATQKVYEDTVNLKALLPRDIRNHEIYFTIQGPQLFVYLITPERRPDNWPIAGPDMYHYRKVLTLSSNFGREVTP